MHSQLSVLRHRALLFSSEQLRLQVHSQLSVPRRRALLFSSKQLRLQVHSQFSVPCRRAAMAHILPDPQWRTPSRIAQFSCNGAYLVLMRHRAAMAHYQSYCAIALQWRISCQNRNSAAMAHIHSHAPRCAPLRYALREEVRHRVQMLGKTAVR